MLLLSSSSNAQKNVGCFSYIPFAYNGLFVTLPEKNELCYYYGKDIINLETLKLGGRVISVSQSQNSLLAFGESQLLGLDWPKKNEKNMHDLETLFPNRNITAYAAPNNGPYQWVAQANEIYRVRMNGFLDQEVVVGFNYGTDIFRIRENWDPSSVVSLSESDLKIVLEQPFLYDLVLLRARFSGGQFGVIDNNSAKIRSLYFNISADERISNLDLLLSLISESSLSKAKKLTLILYPPYWYAGSTQKQAEKIKVDFVETICRFIESQIFTKIIASFPTEDTNGLTYDKRHFKTSKLKYDTITGCN